MAAFKSRLAEIMTERGMTQSELSRLTGIRVSSISDYLRGVYEAKQDKVFLLADALQVNSQWLMGLDTPQEWPAQEGSMEVKDILKTRRLKLGLTLEDIAGKVGVSAATISRWESGDIANMRRDRIVALSNALQISPAVIMGWNEIDKSHYYDQDAAAIAGMVKDNPRYRVLFEMSRKLSSGDVELVINIVKRLAKIDEDFIEQR